MTTRSQRMDGKTGSKLLLSCNLQMVKDYLKVDWDKLKTYTINPKTNTKIKGKVL